jgi:hypothetical protein
MANDCFLAPAERLSVLLRMAAEGHEDAFPRENAWC